MDLLKIKISPIYFDQGTFKRLKTMFNLYYYLFNLNSYKNEYK